MAEDINNIILALDEQPDQVQVAPASDQANNNEGNDRANQADVVLSGDQVSDKKDQPLAKELNAQETKLPNGQATSKDSNLHRSTLTHIQDGATGSTTHNGPQTPKPGKKQVTFNSQASRTKDEPLDGESLLIAATLVLDAKEGRNLPYILSEKCVRSYINYNRSFWRWILYLCIFLILALAVCEEPAVSGMSLPYWASMLFEFFCLAYFTFRICHVLSFQDKRVFFKDAKNVIVMTVILLTVLDMMCYIVWENTASSGKPVRWSRFLRPLFIVNFPDGKQIRRAFRNIRRTVPDILNVLVLFLLSVLIFGLLALKLFYRRKLTYSNGDPYFSNYFDSVWDLYVLVTTANNPDVMMPAYNKSNWFAIFFIVYLILCLYIFMSIVLAAIYNNYRKNLKNEIRSAVFLKRQKLAQAFNLLKVERGDGSVITHGRWRQLTSVLLPGKSDIHCDLLMTILDDDNTSSLDKKNFMNVADLLHVQLTEVKDRLTLIEMLIPKIYNHPYSESFKVVFRHRFVRYVFDLMIAINALFIAIDLDKADWFFLAIFTFEILCNFYCVGFKEYFRRFWYTFDFLVIGSALIASIVEKAAGRSDDEIRTLDALLVLRVMRLVKIFGSIKRFKVILQTLLNIGTSIVTYGGVIFVFFYTFAIIGMELFSGLVHYYGYSEEAAAGSRTAFCGNTRLNNTMFYKDHYCANNFNNIFKAMVVMFELTVVNQWHVITSGFVHVTSKAARLYFFSFHMCTVVIVLNIFTAFILEAFILEYTLQTVPKLESVVEGKIKELGLGIGMKPTISSILGPTGDTIELVDGEEPVDIDPERQDNFTNDDEDSDTDSLPDLSKEKGFKFHIRKRSRKKVEVLLQQMFQGELGDLDEGPEDLVDMENYRRRRKPTLEEIA